MAEIAVGRLWHSAAKDVIKTENKGEPPTDFIRRPARRGFAISLALPRRSPPAPHHCPSRGPTRSIGLLPNRISTSRRLKLELNALALDQLSSAQTRFLRTVIPPICVIAARTCSTRNRTLSFVRLPCDCRDAERPPVKGTLVDMTLKLLARNVSMSLEHLESES